MENNQSVRQLESAIAKEYNNPTPEHELNLLQVLRQQSGNGTLDANMAQARRDLEGGIIPKGTIQCDKEGKPFLIDFGTTDIMKNPLSQDWQKNI